jgi:branched-chain amino acid transport system permease protein
MATLGVSLLLGRLYGQITVWRATSTRSTLGHAQGARCCCWSRFPRAACMINNEDVYRGGPDRHGCWWSCLALFFQKTADRARPARRGRRPPGRRSRIGIRSTASGSLCGRVAGCRGAGGRHYLGLQAGGAVRRWRSWRCGPCPWLSCGGFTSVPGAIIGGLIIGVGEKLSEALLSAHRGWWH